MVYETFQKTITARLRERLGEGCCLLLQKVPKNNGLVLDGLSISFGHQTVAPTIYLNHYYERFREGVSIDELAEEILNIYRDNSPITHADFSILNDFSRLRDRVVYRLIHTLSNQELLADIPSVPYLDLSIVFYLHLEQNEFGQMTALICNRHMAMWNTSLEELYSLARVNTPRLLPAKLKTMTQAIREMAKDYLGSDYREETVKQLLPEHEEAPMYVLSNSSCINGAAAMIYPHVLESMADTLKKDLVILPSSIHEVLLVPYMEHMNFTDLSDMVISINREQVPIEDRLSNHIYLYSRSTGQVTMAPQNPPTCVS